MDTAVIVLILAGLLLILAVILLRREQKILHTIRTEADRLEQQLHTLSREIRQVEAAFRRQLEAEDEPLNS